MPYLVNAILLLAYGVVSATIGLTLFWQKVVQAPLAALSGMTLFLCFAQLHQVVAGLVTRNREGGLSEDMDARMNALESRVNEINKTFADFHEAIETRLDDREKQLVVEVRVLEGLVRELKEQVQPFGHADEHVSEEPDPRNDPRFIDVVRDALEENRIDVYFQPIVSLPQRKRRFFEALSRLRDSDGEIIMPSDYLRVAEPAGLMAVVDNLLLFRCVQVVRRMAKRNPGMAIFCNISGHSLRDDAFFPQFVDYMEANAELSSHLAFEFGQADLQNCSAGEEALLERLAAAGFVFSMDKVRTLDIDFSALHAFHFRFVKIEAQALLQGLEGQGLPVAAADLKAFAQRHGIDLIVEKIEDESTVLDILDYDVDFGQGYLFGLPQPMDVVLQDLESSRRTERKPAMAGARGPKG